MASSTETQYIFRQEPTRVTWAKSRARSQNIQAMIIEQSKILSKYKRREYMSKIWKIYDDFKKHDLKIEVAMKELFEELTKEIEEFMKDNIENNRFQVYEKIITHIRTLDDHIKDMSDWLKDDTTLGETSLLFGLVQMGKTSASLFLSYLSILNKKTVIYTLMNKIYLTTQSQKRAKEFNMNVIDEMKEMMDLNIIPKIDYTIVDIEDFSRKDYGKGIKSLKEYADRLGDTNTNISKLAKFLDPDDDMCGIVFVMGNVSRMKILTRYLDKRLSYLLIVDEADLIASESLVTNKNERKMDKYFRILMNNADRVTFITATIMKIFKNVNIVTSRVFTIPVPETYVGTHNVHNNTDILSIANWDAKYIIDRFNGFDTIIKKIIDSEGTSVKNLKTGEEYILPSHLLITVTNLIEEQKQIFNWIIDNDHIFNKNYVILRWNGGSNEENDPKGVKGYSSAYAQNPEHDIFVMDTDCEGEVDVRVTNGHFTVDSKYFGDILEHFSVNDPMTACGEVTSIVTLTGDYADRGVSIMPTNYARGHLTDQIYVAPKSMKIDTLMQRQRINGDMQCHFGQYCPTLWTLPEESDALRKGAEITLKYAEMAKNAIGKKMTVNDVINSTKLPGVLYTKVKFFDSKQIPNSAASLKKGKNFCFDGRSKVNTECIGEFSNMSFEQDHLDMYKVGASPGLKHRAGMRDKVRKIAIERKIIIEEKVIEIDEEPVEKYDESSTWFRINGRLERDNGETNISFLKRIMIEYLKSHKNTYKKAKEWLKITGLCGFKNVTTYHMIVMSRLTCENFLERHENQLRIKV
jgi:hypothetical protein